MAEELTVLATHRIVRGLGDAAAAEVLVDCARYFDVERLDDAAAARRIVRAGGRAPGRLRAAGALDAGRRRDPRARREALAPFLPAGGEALRRLDVTILQAALGRLTGIDPAAVALGERVAYAKSAAEAVEAVEAGTGGADAAFLLEPTPVSEVSAVATAGDVMPQSRRTSTRRP